MTLTRADVSRWPDAEQRRAVLELMTERDEALAQIAAGGEHANNSQVGMLPRAQLADARKAALEEAARWFENEPDANRLDWTMEGVVSELRALAAAPDGEANK